MKQRKITAPHQQNKISKEKVQYCRLRQSGKQSQQILLSFRYLTRNKKHNLNKINKLKANEGNKIYRSIFKRIDEMSHMTWQELTNESRKARGKELIEYGELKFKVEDPEDVLKLTADAKLHVFRCGNDYRLIGYKGKACTNVLYVIGFDFDFSAYNHG